MLTSRSIPEPEWERARRHLVSYFGRRGVRNAEDLAQDTVAEVWRRDFPFEAHEDFLKVCYAFARRILLAHIRKNAAEAHFDDLRPSGKSAANGLEGPELMVFLDEVINIGSTQFAEEWNAIHELAMNGKAPIAEGANSGYGLKLRVAVHRARHELAKLTGWKR